MIVPMNKYSFVLYHREYDEFLKDLAQLGVVDVSIRKHDIDDNIRNKMIADAQVSEIINFLSKRTVEHVEDGTELKGEDVVAAVKQLQSDIDKLNHKVTQLKKELAILEPWGEYSADLIKKLFDEGYRVRFYTTPSRRFTLEMEDNESIIEINRAQSTVYFVTVDHKDKEADIDADEIKIPAISPSDLRNELDRTLKEIETSNSKIDEYAARYIPALEQLKKRILNEVEYQQVMLKTIREADDKLFILNGFAPVTNETDLENHLKSSGVIYYKEKPIPSDDPPVLLKNNKFAKLFEPITEIFSLPNYGEKDLTALFAPFFMMFFGFCMGDFMYGVVMVLAGLILRRFVSDNMKPYLKLAVYLGIATMFFGLLGGTIVGFDMETISAFQPLHKFMLDDMAVFYLALGLGVLQIVYGMIIQAYNRAVMFGFKYSLALIGVLLAIFGVIDIAIVKIGGNISLYVIYAGIALMFFFSDPDINTFARLGKGVWDLYSNITGIFGDVLSYIRLFALSASGGILGYVINSISLPLLDINPILGPIIFVLVMVVGHGANIALSGLSAFVHPMRLTFVEFYKNAGFAGGGKKYNPYSKH